MDADKLKSLEINREDKRRSSGALWGIFIAVLLIAGVVIFYAIPRTQDATRTNKNGHPTGQNGGASPNSGTSNAPGAVNYAKSPVGVTGSVLTAPGYIINRERIEVSPRFMGVVRWIGVKKGDAVTNGQIVVRLDDAEYKAQLRQAEGRLAAARVAISKAELDYDRAKRLVSAAVEMTKTEDDARLALEQARAATLEIEGQIQLINTYLDWTIIRSPINGVVLEKLVDSNELVTPQSFGGTRGPSTALIAVGDPQDLQVDLDINATSIGKVHPNQKCKVTPEAYLDRQYDGYVVEVAPEGNRQKGTLQVKVQILNPDKYLTPELSATVDFLKE